MPVLERLVLLRVIDSLWVEHLTAVDDMRRGIGLRAYSQRDPLNEFKVEAYRMFDELKATIRHDVTHTIFRVTVVQRAAQPRPPDACRRAGPTSSGAGPDGSAGGARPPPPRSATAGERQRRLRPGAAGARAVPSSGATTRAGAGRARSSSAATGPDRAAAITIGQAVKCHTTQPCCPIPAPMLPSRPPVRCQEAPIRARSARFALWSRPASR